MIAAAVCSFLSWAWAEIMEDKNPQLDDGLYPTQESQVSWGDNYTLTEGTVFEKVGGSVI
jgi:hypothetical protein